MAGGLVAAAIPLSAQTWELTSAPFEAWSAIACSSNGSELVAGPTQYGGIYISTNAGATWTQTSAPVTTQPRPAWNALVSSADGTKLAAAELNYDASSTTIYTSADAGATWVPANALLDSGISSIASSADGRILVADKQRVLLQRISGPTGPVPATRTGRPSSSAVVACSSDGTKIILAYDGGKIYTSTNSGAVWTLSTGPDAYWTQVASSFDGSHLVAAGWSSLTGGAIIISTNAGLTWRWAPSNIRSIGPLSPVQRMEAELWWQRRQIGIYTSTNADRPGPLTIKNRRRRSPFQPMEPKWWRCM